MIRIERRYQWRAREGIKWTYWFKHSEYETMEEAKEALKALKKRKNGDKKLLGEYRIVE